MPPVISDNFLDMLNRQKGGAGVTILIIVVLLILAGVLFYTNKQDDATPIEDAVSGDETATDTPAVEGASATIEVGTEAEASTEVAAEEGTEATN
ncbi:MAG: hypothetical protein AMXMBFR44_5770 [Candidatus Campbellbacteria bacterium]